MELKPYLVKETQQCVVANFIRQLKTAMSYYPATDRQDLDKDNVK